MKRTSVLLFVFALFELSGLFAKEKNSSKVKTVRAAFVIASAPYNFVNKEGNPDGFEVAVLKEVDKLLPEYDFQFIPASDEDLLIGIETGKYDVGTKEAWATDERKKKFIFPRNPTAASILGLAYRTSDSAKIHDFESFAKSNGRLIPLSPNNAQYAVVKDYNSKHPDAQIKLDTIDTFPTTDAYTWILEGRYDGFLVIKNKFYNNVLADNAPYNKYKDKLSWFPYKGIPTWPLFNKKDQALADAYDKAVDTLKANGTIAALSQKYFGEDVFKFVTD